MATPTIKPSANIAIVWGTANAAAGNNAAIAPSGMILETLTVTPKNADPIDIEGGAVKGPVLTLDTELWRE